MRQEFFTLELVTNGQKLYEFTENTLHWINDLNLNNGLLNLSIQHTSASLIVQENADPDVRIDLKNYFNKLVPMDENLYIHKSEGKDDMPAHIKTALTNTNLTLSIIENNLKIGIWQGIYLRKIYVYP